MYRVISCSSSKVVIDIYQRKTQIEHILHRPDTYIGSVNATERNLWVYSTVDQCMALKKTKIVPGFYKIFDEILVNATGNKVRDPSMNTLKVNINKEKNIISVFNNGMGVPIEFQSKEGIYTPELIFGHLPNRNDFEKKNTGYYDGYGAKLCNIYSLQFIVEIGSKENGQHYKQVFSNNMSTVGKPFITTGNKTDYTKITFQPDLAKFGMYEIDDVHQSLFIKRVYDIAGCFGGDVQVYLNEHLISIKSFEDYVKLYLKDKIHNKELGKPVIIYERIKSERRNCWEVCFTQSESQFQQVSFVNSISTSKGGTHVQYVADQIINKLLDCAKARCTSTLIKKRQVKNQCWIFINCSIENPTFDSPTKECLTLRPSKFGSKPILSNGFMTKLASLAPVVESITNLASISEGKMLKKSDNQKKSRLSRLNNLDDANFAGTERAKDCTLILTKGDSAKALAMSGLEIVGRDYFGIFPLSGKVFDVRGASRKQIYENIEINNVKRILGLRYGKKYHTTQSLRYGHLMIMTDQNHNGSHSKDLIVKFIDHFWPTLLKNPGFLREFITPIIRVKKDPLDISFFTIPEYEAWKKCNNNGIGWSVEYHKGLGANTASDAKLYFAALKYYQENASQAKPTDHFLIDLALDGAKGDGRKVWLRKFEFGICMNYNASRVEVSDFIAKELIFVSMNDNIHSVPSLIDGLKPGHRKVLFNCFQKKLKTRIKQLADYVREHCSYRHGKQSLCAIIIGLAQNFMGSNNINLLEPIGQFGTRAQARSLSIEGGKDAAHVRHIHTSLADIAPFIFHPADEPLLAYLKSDDGQIIEPQWYIPIVPLLLINGGEGVGTGWSSTIPNYNPLDVIENLKRKMNGRETFKMTPWYRGFKGTIIPISHDKYKVAGIIKKTSPTSVEINELPVRSWTQPFKDYLESLLSDEDKEPFIKSYKECHTHTSIQFKIELSEEKMKEAESEGLENKFKLVNYISTSNMVCCDKNLRIRKYHSPEEMLGEFYEVRLEYYVKRKEWLLRQLVRKKENLENKAHFLREMIDGTIVLHNRKKRDILTELEQKGYKTDVDTKVYPSGEDTKGVSLCDEITGYNYLLDMPISSFTQEKIDQCLEEIAINRQEIRLLEGKSPTDLWDTDLENLKYEWQKSVNGPYKGTETEVKAQNSTQLRKLRKPQSKRILPQDSSSKASDMLKYSSDNVTSRGRVIIVTPWSAQYS
ncbi:DNA topoisomerase II [Basidiobolus meristosporus CBS 931.73]|uniref:DNA topoisomerase 2 n=1 Tax=Basidiobolus meristosporus CBS 931.73 TaxID=1314790 RepID=A0A1Y1XN39_9FUNG|nr:DNA topoisomerase II [Basidiobolus meristosporus CBS 931.73]|eukprot:ORX87085.1 DNA topoisomerase II [Basidiobolus meristosporus CBS 931.73]